MKPGAIGQRFIDLLEQAKAVESTKHYRERHMISGDYVDDNKFLNWKLKARNLVAKACGENSEHYRTFAAVEGGAYVTNLVILQRLKAVLEAAREDYEGGFCNSVRNLVQAEVFSDELEQARELLAAGYLTPAAVIAGVVLETTLRKLCHDHGIAVGKLDKMNADLTKAGQYSLLVQKRITALADVRNSAAHGHPEKFSQQDVNDMIMYVEGFVADQI